MKKINYNEYFDSKEDKYYEPQVMINLLETLSGREFKIIISFLTKSKINVTDEQIETYLDRKFKENDLALKTRIEIRKKHKTENKTSEMYINIKRLTKEEINDVGKEFIDNLAAKKYEFDPAVLSYYKSYSLMCATKAKEILLIIGSICNIYQNDNQEMLEDLDIQLDTNGDILKSDIIRLVKPAIYNINEFEKTIESANNLDTYLEKKFSEEELIDGMVYCHELEIQKKNLYNDLYEGNVPLTKKQEEEILEKQSNYAAKILSLIED